MLFINSSFKPMLLIPFSSYWKYYNKKPPRSTCRHGLRFFFGEYLGPLLMLFFKFYEQFCYTTKKDLLQRAKIAVEAPKTTTKGTFDL